MTDPDIEVLQRLREPLPSTSIAKLPRYVGPKDVPKNQRDRHRCNECGTTHEFPAIHLDYAGHAAVTDRLLESDPTWRWEPMARDEDGLPRIIRGPKMAKLWILLTVGGVTRPGVGSAEVDKDDVEKELVSDALRNAAMRFGVALDLWHKGGDLHDSSTPAIPDQEPDEWFVANGWLDRQHHDEFTNETKDILRSLSEGKQREFRQWREDQGEAFAKLQPVPQKVAQAMRDKANELLGDPPPDGGGALTEPTADGSQEALAEKRGLLTDEYRGPANAKWHDAGLPNFSTSQLTGDELERAHAIVDQVLKVQKADFDRRRRAANAAMTKVGVKSDPARHELVSKATDGATQSTAALTQDQLDAIKRFCHELEMSEAS